MGDFKIIETQEQFDAAIGERIKRERESLTKQYNGYLSPDEVAKKYEGYISPEEAAKQKLASEKQIGDLTKELNNANGKIADFTNQIADKDNKIKGYESLSVKTRIAHEKGLSYEAIDFLKGDDEDSIRKSADSLVSLVGRNNVAPLASNENINYSEQDAALKNTLKQLKGE